MIDYFGSVNDFKNFSDNTAILYLYSIIIDYDNYGIVLDDDVDGNEVAQRDVNNHLSSSNDDDHHHDQILIWSVFIL